MTGVDTGDVRKAYTEVADACKLETATRAQPWAAASDSHLLSKVLQDVDKENDRILDLGCCGKPWVTNLLEKKGYDVVGVDLPKHQWEDYDLEDELGVTLIGYDGHELPFGDSEFDLVLMFGVLEHVGVWKDDSTKFDEPNEDIWKHRREVLREVRRVLTPDGVLYITKFPNRYGRDKLYASDGHLNSERTRPQKLISEVGQEFVISEFFMNGIFPHRIPFNTPLDALPEVYARLDDFISNLPGVSQVAQNYCVIARVT